jgi:hypothetical protein
VNVAESLNSIPPVEAIVRLARTYPVFPCRRSAESLSINGRTRLLKPKSPLTSRGFFDASSDPDQIRAWWRRWPDALVGVPTGPITGLLVVDFDSHKASQGARDWIDQHTDWLLQTRSHGTVSGGRHYLYRLPPGQEFGSGVNVALGGAARHGIDIRSSGGYIVWWPLHGGNATGEIAPLPAGLIEERRIERRELPPLPLNTSAKWASDRSRVADALAWADPGEYDTWCRTGMALHLASGGSDDGFDLWHAWSAGEITGEVPSSYSGLNDCRAHWETFNAAGRERAKLVTLGSVFAAARVAGWVPQRVEREAPPPPGDVPPWLDVDDQPPPFAEFDEPAAAAVAEEGEEGKKPKREPLNWAVLKDATLPQREWAIPHWLGAGYVTLLAGPGGVGKSLLAQQMASALSVGDEFLEPIERSRRVLLWAGEDDKDELWRRQVAIAQLAGRDLDEYSDLFIESYAGRDCTLASAVFGQLEPTRILTELAEQVADYDIDVVFLDNIARLFGGNENERHHVTLFVNLVAGACTQRKKSTAIVLLGHPAKAEGSEWAGSTAWEAAVRSRWFFGRTLPDAAQDEQPGDPNRRYLSRRKSNYSALDARQMRYDMTRHVLVMEAGVEPERALHSGRAEHLVIEALQALVAQGVSTSDGRKSPQFLPKVMVERKLATRSQIPALTDALYRLQAAGRVAHTKVGTYSNRTPKMGLGVA